MQLMLKNPWLILLCRILGKFLRYSLSCQADKKINHLSETPLLIIIQREFPQADKIKITRSEDKLFM